MSIQLDFFEETDDISELRRKDEFLLDRIDNMRRGLFKRHELHQKSINTLLTMNVKLQEEVASLKEDLEQLRGLLIRQVK
jgi:hypothetical protein